MPPSDELTPSDEMPLSESGPYAVERWSWLLAGGLTAAFSAVALGVRPLLPIDETRYVSVAWWMRQTGDYLIPQLHGHPYGHKPPLLFWSIDLFWSIFGVNEAAVRALGLAWALMALGLTSRLARRLWPAATSVASLVPLVLVASPLWLIVGSLVMFEMPLSATVVVTILGLHALDAGQWRCGYLLTIVGLSLSILTKGPVILLHAVPVVIAYPWWTRSTVPAWRFWFRFVICLAAAVLPVVIWLAAATWIGGRGYLEEVLWTQYLGRVVHSFDHAHGTLFYVPMLTAALFPWLIFLIPDQLRSVSMPRDRSTRLCVAWAAGSILLFSLASGKQIHYLTTSLIPISLLVAHKVVHDRSPVREQRFRWWPWATAAVGAIPILLAWANIDEPIVQALNDRWLLGCGLFLFASAATMGYAGRVFPHRMARPATLVATVATVSVLALSLLQLAIFYQTPYATGLTPVAQAIHQYQHQGRRVAHYRWCDGQYDFLGRLNRPPDCLRDGAHLRQWERDHPRGVIVLQTNRPLETVDRPLGRYRIYIDFKPRFVTLVTAGSLSRSPFVGSHGLSRPRVHGSP